MKNLKKVLALVLAFACAFTMFAGAAFTDQADINADNVDAVDLLTTLKIIKGYEDGSFDPEGTVDRAEMAKMIYTIRNGGNDDASAHVGNTTSFTDISGHWAEGYIKYLQNTGIVAGKSATQFAPDAQVTTAEAMKMALALAGYDEENAGLTGIDWQKNTLTYATTIGLTDNVASAMSAGCTRQDAAQILANCLSATAVRYSAVVENFVNDSKTGLSFGGDPISVGNKWMDLWTSIGTLIGINGKDLTITANDADRADSDKDENGVMVEAFINVDTDYSELLGQKVKVLFRDGKNNTVIGVYATTDNTVYTVEANDTSKDEDKVAFGGNSYRLDDEGRIRTYTDGSAASTWTTLDQLDHNALNPNMYTFVDTDDNGRLDTLVVRTYNVAKVSYVASDRVIAGSHTYQYDDEIIADGVEDDGWVVITRDMYNDCWSVAPVAVESADLDGMRDNKSVNPYFDGQGIDAAAVQYDEYEIGDAWYNGAAALQSNRSESDLKNVKTVQAVDYVAVNGIMFYIERSSGTNTGRVDNVAVVLATSNHSAVEDQARIAFFNGDTAVVSVSDKGDKKLSDDSLKVGQAYEYDVINGEYRFYELKVGYEKAANYDKDYEEYYGDLSSHGEQRVNNNGSGDDLSIASLNGGSFDGVRIDDNAQVLLYWTTSANGAGVKDDWDVVSITGKQFKAIQDVADLNDDNTAGDGVKAGSYAYAFSGDMDGLYRIGALAVQVDPTAALDDLGIPTWNHYGYIMNDAKWSGENNNIAEYTLFTNNRLYRVVEEVSNREDRSANTVLGFDSLTRSDDGTAVLSRAAVENVEEGTYNIEGAVLLTDDKADGELKFTAVTAVRGDTVEFSNGETVDIGGATIIYVDTNNDTALDTGSVTVAEKDPNTKKWMANALYIGADNGDCELLVIDQGLYLKSDYYYNNQGVKGTNGNTQYGITDTQSGGETQTGTVYESADALQSALREGDVVATGLIPVPANGTYSSTNTLTLEDAYITDQIIATGPVELEGDVRFSSDGKIESFDTITIAADANVDLNKVKASEINNQAAETSTDDLETMLRNATTVTVKNTTIDDDTDLAGNTLNAAALTVAAMPRNATANSVNATSVDASAVDVTTTDNLNALLGWAKDVEVKTAKLDADATIAGGIKLTTSKIDATEADVTVANGGTLVVTNVAGLKVDADNGITVQAGATVDLGNTKYVGNTADYLMTVKSGSVYRYGDTAKWTVEGEIVINKDAKLENDNFDLSAENAKITVAAGAEVTLKNATISDGSKIVGTDATSKIIVDTQLTVSSNAGKFVSSSGSEETSPISGSKTYEWQTDSNTWKANA